MSECDILSDSPSVLVESKSSAERLVTISAERSQKYTVTDVRCELLP